MGQFLGRSLKKCLHFFSLYLSLVFFILLHIFKKCLQLENQLYNYTMYCIQHSVKKNTNYTIVFQYFWFFTKFRRSVLHILIFTTNTAKSPLFLSREITLYNIVHYRWYCQTMTAILTVLPSLKITHPYQPPFPNSSLSL